MQKIYGFYFANGSSKKQEAFLLFDNNGFLSVFHRDGEKLAEPENIRHVSIASRLGNTPRIIRFKDNRIFETSDNDRIDACLKQFKPHHTFIHALESRFRYVVIAFFATVLFVWGAIQYGIPALAEQVAFAIPAESSRMLGQGALEFLDKGFLGTSTLPTERQEELRKKFSSLINNEGSLSVRIEFRDAKKSLGANAFALPDGTVVFTDQLVEMAENNDELIGVYAHEVGHIVRRHSMRNVLQSSAFAVIIIAVTGDVSSVPALITAAPTLIVQSGYSRNFEREADLFAVQQLLQHNIDPMNLGTVLTRMEKADLCDEKKKNCHARKSDWTDYLSTHPGTDERILLIQKEAAAYHAQQKPPQ